ncbi:MAG: hydrogenase expression protein HupH [Gammaproteobacteria bacterium]|nr:hydrogenase expression protein HupH [Gammaproteobacteria bacterium]
MSHHIRVITPIVSDLFSEAQLQPYATDSIRLTHTRIDKGPASIESTFDEALAQPDTLVKVLEAEEEGCDAIVINCLGDPALNPAREIVNIPVVGPYQASMHLANMLGDNFAVISVLDNVRLLLEHLAAKYSLSERYVGFDYVNISVLDLEADLDGLVKAMTEKSVMLIEGQQANSIILGCTGMLGCAQGIRTQLLDRGLDVPVIDPLVAAIQMAEAMVSSDLSHSHHAYQTPPEKDIVGYSFPDRKENKKTA